MSYLPNQTKKFENKKKNRKLQELIMFLVFCLVVWVYLTKLFYITLSDKGKWQKSAHKMKNSGQWSDRVDCKLYCNRVVEIWFVSRIILLLHPAQWNMQQHSSYAFILRLKLYLLSSESVISIWLKFYPAWNFQEWDQNCSGKY